MIEIGAVYGISLEIAFLKQNIIGKNPIKVRVCISGDKHPTEGKAFAVPFLCADVGFEAQSHGSRVYCLRLTVGLPFSVQDSFTACGLGFGHSGFSPAGFQPQVSRRHRTFFPLEPSLSWRNITRGHD